MVRPGGRYQADESRARHEADPTSSQTRPHPRGTTSMRIPGQRLAQVHRQGLDRGQQAITHGYGAVSIWQVDQHREPGLALDQGGDGGAAVRPEHESGSGTHCCVPAPSEPCKQLFTAHGSSKPQGLAVRRRCRIRQLGGSIPPLTKGVEETDSLIARRATARKRDVLLGDRLSDDGPPRFPFLRGSRRVIGVQQEPSADRQRPCCA